MIVTRGCEETRSLRETSSRLTSATERLVLPVITSCSPKILSPPSEACRLFLSERLGGSRIRIPASVVPNLDAAREAAQCNTMQCTIMQCNAMQCNVM